MTYKADPLLPPLLNDCLAAESERDEAREALENAEREIDRLRAALASRDARIAELTSQLEAARKAVSQYVDSDDERMHALQEARAAGFRRAIEMAAQALVDEVRLRPTAWGALGSDPGPLGRMVREIRALADDGQDAQR